MVKEPVTDSRDLLPEDMLAKIIQLNLLNIFFFEEKQKKFNRKVFLIIERFVLIICNNERESLDIK